jgi:hypothetical protein
MTPLRHNVDSAVGTSAVPLRSGRVPRGPGGRAALLVGVKAVHTVVWVSIESCVGYLVWSGWARRTDRRAAIAGAIVAAETIVFAGSGCRCPLTAVADSLGDGRGSVTDIFLPSWLAHALPVLHVPLLLLVAYWHGRNALHVDLPTAGTSRPFGTAAGVAPPRRLG